MLNDLCDVCPVTTSHLACDTLGQVNETAVHPVLPEDSNSRCANAGAERCNIWLNHAESSVDGPEEEENDEHVVSIPEALKVCSSRLLGRRENHTHQRNKHDIASPTRSRHKIGNQPAVDTKLVLDGDLGKVIPVSNGMDPRPENDGPGGDDVEGDVLVELEDAIERCLSKERDEGSRDGEENDGDVDMEDQSG